MRFILFFLFIALSSCSGGPPKSSQSLKNWPAVSDWNKGYSGKNDIAVIVAIEEYAFLPPVPGARESANDWEAFFRQKKGMQDVFVLTDKNASLEEMQRFVRNAVSESNKDGTLWFVFVGHGAANPSGTDGLLIGMDANQSYESIKARSLSRIHLQELLSAGQQKQTVVVLDACFSGRATNGNALVKGAQPVIVTTMPKTPPNMMVLSAAKGSEIAGPLPEVARPAFSYLLLGGLRGWADSDDDAIITSGELMTFAQRQLRSLPGRQQTPTLMGADNVILSRKAGEVDPGIQRMMTGGPDESAKEKETADLSSLLIPRGKATGRSCQSSAQCGDEANCFDGQCEEIKEWVEVSFDGVSEKGFHFYGLNWTTSAKEWVHKLGKPREIKNINSRLAYLYYKVRVGKDIAILELQDRSGKIINMRFSLVEKFEDETTQSEVFDDLYSVVQNRVRQKTQIQREGTRAISLWELADGSKLSVTKAGNSFFLNILPPEYRFRVDEFLQRDTHQEKKTSVAKPVDVGWMFRMYSNVIDTVAKDSPAAKAGLKVGDRIIKVGRFNVGNNTEVISMMNKFRLSSTEVKITILRKDRKLLGIIAF